MSIFNYSTTPGANTSVDGVNIAEGMPPGNVNNAMRAMMADTRKFQLDTGGGPVTAGTGDNFTLSVNQSFTEYTNGMRFTFRFDRANLTDTPTININGRGQRNLRIYRNAEALPPFPGELPQNGIGDIVFSSADNAFVLMGRYSTLPRDITIPGAGLIGSTSDGTEPAIRISLGNGVEFSGTSLRAKIGAGLSFLAGGIVATVQRIATQAEALAGTENTAAMTALRVREVRDAQMLGWNQTPQAFFGPSRVVGTTYTNETGRPILVSVVGFDILLQSRANNTATWINWSAPVGNSRQHQAVIVPNGQQYRVASGSYEQWSELR